MDSSIEESEKVAHRGAEWHHEGCFHRWCTPTIDQANGCCQSPAPTGARALSVVEAGWSRVVGADPERIVEAAINFELPERKPSVFGIGDAAYRIVRDLENRKSPFVSNRWNHEE